MKVLRSHIRAALLFGCLLSVLAGNAKAQIRRAEPGTRNPGSGACRASASQVQPLLPVVVLPGIMGSYLAGDDGLVWIEASRALFHPRDSYLEDLSLDSTGTSIRRIRIAGIFDGSRSWMTDRYGLLVTCLKEAGYREGTTLFVFPYDWRMDNAQTAEQLQQFIEEVVVPRSGSMRVDIVAHSMGGLVVRYYATLPGLRGKPDSSGAERLSSVLYIGTPHRGAVKAFGLLAFDDSLAEKFMKIRFLNTNTLASISRTFPSLFQLLSRTPFLLDKSNAKQLTLEQTYMQPPVGYGFLKNSRWVTNAESFHARIGRTKGPRWYSIVGTGIPTLAEVDFYGMGTSRRTWCGVSGDGDATVLLQSAAFPDHANSFPVRNVEHEQLPNNEIVHKIVLQILRQDRFSSPSYSLPGPPMVVEWCSGSPVRIVVRDFGGRTAGYGEDGTLRNDIPRASFFRFEENESGFLDPDQPYLFAIRGIAPGTFSLSLEFKEGGKLYKSFRFTGVPVTASSVGQLELDARKASLTIMWDLVGNGDSRCDISSEMPVDTQWLARCFQNVLEPVASTDLRTAQLLRELLKSNELELLRAEVEKSYGRPIPPPHAEALLVITELLADTARARN